MAWWPRRCWARWPGAVKPGIARRHAIMMAASFRQVNGSCVRPHAGRRSVDPVQAAVVQSLNAADPLAGLWVGEVRNPSPPDGWSVVRVRAAALNHHDIWSLRGVGLGTDELPRILGCDAAGVDAEGNAVVVHAVIGDAAAGGGDETLDPRRSLLSERYDGTLAEFVVVPTANLVPDAGGAQLRGGRMPAHCLADRVSDAHGQLGDRARRHGADPGRRRRRVDGLGSAGKGSRTAGLGDQSFGAAPCPDRRPWRRCGFRVGCPTAGPSRRRVRQRRRSNLGALAAQPSTRRHDGDLRGHEWRCHRRPS